MKQNNKIKTIIMISIIIIIQTIAFIIVGINKSYIHMDEAYSLGLASYDKVEIQANEDFYNKWHNKEYYEDYLAVNSDEVGEYKQVYENQKNDVHPPLYYLLLRFAMGFSIDNYSKWPGIILNIIIYIAISIFMFLIINKLLEGKDNSVKKSLFITLVASLTMATLTNVIYIRMYALSALNIVITTYLHLKLLDSKQNNYKLLFCIMISALIGSLTHYYYLFYLAMLFIMFVIKYIREKRYKELASYVITMLIAGALSLAIFPYSIKHMFFGYRGQGAISNLTNIFSFISGIIMYLAITNIFCFNNLLFIILTAIIGIVIYKKYKKIKVMEKNKYIKYILLPTLFYFVLVATSAPWKELRYIMPISGMIFILVMFYLEEILENLVKEKTLNIIIIVLSTAMIIIMPIIYNMEPEVMYSDKKEITNKLENELNLPTIFLFNSNNNRFLDDILLFAKINESYIAKDLECTEENIKNIMAGKDISNGMIVFINEGQNNDELLLNIKNAMELGEIIYLKRLNACDVYYLK